MLAPSPARRTLPKHAADAAEPVKAVKADDTADEISTDDESDSDSDSSSYDACDELFKQGEWLRKLRLLEQEDEAMREKERLEQEEKNNSDSDSNDDDDGDTLDYNKYLRNQRGIYDDYKHVNYKYIDFGIIGDDDVDDENSDGSGTSNRTTAPTRSPLVIEQDPAVGKGGFVWDAGFVLAESVLRMESSETDWLRRDNTKIIELGAGTGVTSLLIASARPNTTVHLTDLPRLQPLLASNCRKQARGNATHGVLEWGTRPDRENDASIPYDVILAADVVAGIYDSSGLAETIRDLSHEKTVVYVACRERLEGVIDRFVSHLAKLFARIEKLEADSTNKSPDVFVLRVSGKRVCGNGANR